MLQEAFPYGDRAARIGVAYRTMTTSDRSFLSTLYRSTREDEMANLPWNDDQKQTFIDMQFNAQHEHYQKNYPNALWLIIEISDTRIGRLYLEHWDHEIRIIDIALTPSARGRGIGSAILQDLQNEASEADKKIGIHVEKLNPAMTLYKRLGFQTVQDKGVYDLLTWMPARLNVLA